MIPLVVLCSSSVCNNCLVCHLMDCPLYMSRAVHWVICGRIQRQEGQCPSYPEADVWQCCSEAAPTGAALCQVRFLFSVWLIKCFPSSKSMHFLVLICPYVPPKCLCVLLFDRDARGMTPFMLAVSGRAYPAAITVLEAAQKMAKSELIIDLSFCCQLVCHFVAANLELNASSACFVSCPCALWMRFNVILIHSKC